MLLHQIILGFSNKFLVFQDVAKTNTNPWSGSVVVSYMDGGGGCYTVTIVTLSLNYIKPRGVIFVSEKKYRFCNYCNLCKTIFDICNLCDIVTLRDFI